MLVILLDIALCFVLFLIFYYRTSLIPTKLGVSKPLRMSIALVISLIGIAIAYFFSDTKTSLLMIPITLIVGFISNRISEKLHHSTAKEDIALLMISETTDNEATKIYLQNRMLSNLMWIRVYVDLGIRSPGMLNPEVLSKIRIAVNQEFMRRNIQAPPVM